MTDVLRLIKAYCELACRESSSRNKDRQECLQECLEWGIRTVRENIRHFGLTNLSIDYDEEEGFEEDEEYYEETPAFFAQFSRDDGDEYRASCYSRVGPATAFYLNVDAVLRKYGITTAVDSNFYYEVMEEMSTQGTVEDAVRGVLRKRGILLST